MSESHIPIQKIATLARLQISEEEAAKFDGQLSKILAYMQVLENYALGDVEPTAHAMPVYDVWREDETRDGLTHEAALSNAPRKSAGQFLITRVVEE